MNPTETQIRKLFMEIIDNAQEAFNSAKSHGWKINMNNIRYNLNQIDEKLKQLK